MEIESDDPVLIFSEPRECCPSPMPIRSEQVGCQLSDGSLPFDNDRGELFNKVVSGLKSGLLRCHLEDVGTATGPQGVPT